MNIDEFPVKATEFQKIYQAVMEQRQEILRLAIAKYGIDDPKRMVQVFRQTPDGCTWYIKIISDEELKELSMQGASL